MTVEEAQGEGVLVADLARDGLAAEAGIKRGDVIVSINRKRIAGVADYQRSLQQAPGGNLIVLVRRGTASMFFALKLK
jgi:S1-C subfamily serine protease